MNCNDWYNVVALLALLQFLFNLILLSVWFNFLK
jgi:hypothetical protein